MAINLKGIYIPVRADYTKFKEDMTRANALAKQTGKSISDSLNNAIGAGQAQSGVKKLTSNLATAQRALTATSFKGAIGGLDELASIAGVSSERFQSLSQQMLRTAQNTAAERAFASLQKQTGMSALSMAMLRLELGDVSGAFTTLGKAAWASKGAIAAVAATVLFAGKQAFDADLKFQRLEQSYKTITGTSAKAAEQLQYFYDVSKDLGLQFQRTAEGAKTFFAAGKGTDLEPQMRNIFEAVSQAGASLSLTTDDMNGMFIALGQMISKGKVQTEELRRQLGERLPGAFMIAAKAMGVSTAELDKMLELGQVTAEDMLPKLAEELKNTFTQGASVAQRAVNNLSTEWERFLAAMSQTDAAVWVMNDLAESFKSIADNAKIAREEADLLRRMGAAGIARPLVEDEMGSNVVLEYTQAQKEAFKALEARRNAVRNLAAAEKDINLQAAQAIDTAVSRARGTTSGFLSGTQEEKQKKIISEYETAVNNIERARKLDLSNSKKYDNDLVKLSEEKNKKLKDLNKQAENDATDYANSLAKINDKLADLTLNESQLAEYNLNREFDELAKSVGTANPQLQRYIQLQRERNELERSIKQWSQTSAVAGTDFSGRDIAFDEQFGRERVKVNADNMRLQQEFSQKVIESSQSESAAKLAELEKQAAVYRKAKIDESAVDAWLANEKIKYSERWQDGVQRGFDSYVKNSKTAAQAAEDAVVGAFESMEDAIVEFVTTGKISFSDFANSVIADMVRMAVQQSITKPLAGAASSLFSSGASSILGAFFHGGGVIGRDAPTFTREVSPSVFNNAPKFHSGLMPDEFPAILQDGETVIPKGGFGVSSSSPVNLKVEIINESGNNVETQQFNSGDGTEGIRVYIRSEMQNAMMSDIGKNGPITRALGSRFGSTLRVQR